MKKSINSILTISFFAIIIFWVQQSEMPHFDFSKNVPMSKFSTKRALEHVKIIAQKPHYVGSPNHKQVANYLEIQLKELGLDVKTEDGFTLLDSGTLVKSHNILARIKGTNNSKCLLLLSHYESAPHSKSKGASDDGVGIATILEGVRALLHNNTSHKNDIIILFSDAEELGLNGAAQFVTQSKWAKEVGLAINFEARGTSGTSYMLMEVNNGNAEMVKHFQEANPKFAVGNSLMYSIYKMLPNDTDLTIFREQGKIPGYNFAFIDSHFNYHSAQDDMQHLSKNSLEHQGTYIMPLLDYFKDVDLSELNSTIDYVYFNTPFNFVSYPFSWNIIISIISLVCFCILVFIGLGKRILDISEIFKGFLYFFLSIIISGGVGFILWKIILLCYPKYQDILHGFTYNGHYYILGFLSLVLSINFWIYRKLKTNRNSINIAIAPLFIWIIISFLISSYLPGGGFFIIPVLCNIFILCYYVVTQKTNLLVLFLFSVPVIILIYPFLRLLPVGLGLKMIYVSCVLLSLLFGLLLPVLGNFESKKTISILLLLTAVGFFVQAHINSDYEFGKAKPNSLLYVQDTDSQKANWATYDLRLDSWTAAFFGKNPNNTSEINLGKLKSKYNSGFSYSAAVKFKNIPSPTIQFLKDSIVGNKRFLKILISPNRVVNRYDVFAPEDLKVNNFRANNTKPLQISGSIYLRNQSQFLRYYVVNNEPLLLEFDINKSNKLDMQLLESSFDLLENPSFKIPKRENWMMPTPFVLNDAIVIKQQIKPSPIVNQDQILVKNQKLKKIYTKPKVANPVITQ